MPTFQQRGFGRWRTGVLAATIALAGLAGQLALTAGRWPTAPLASTPVATAPASARWTEVSAVATKRPVVALTFDAGADVGQTSQTLDVLQSYGVRATFFVTGQFAENFPDAVQRMVDDGHELANHSYSHRDFTDLSDASIVRELERTDAILSAFSGVTTQPLMRMPYGARDQRVLNAVAETGYRSIYWALDSSDWRDTATAAGVTRRVLNNTSAGDIVVFHCATRATAGALPTILDGLAEQGLAVVTVSNLLQDEG